MNVEFHTCIKKPEDFHGENYWEEYYNKIRDFLNKKKIDYKLSHDHECYLRDEFFLFIEESDVHIIDELNAASGLQFQDNEGFVTKLLKKIKNSSK